MAQEPNEIEESMDVDEERWKFNLPPEILLKILKIGAKQYGQVPFLCKVARVCQKWYQMAYLRDLWIDIDVSSGNIRKDPAGLLQLAEVVFGPHVKTLNLDSWSSLRDFEFKKLCSLCPEVTNVKLSGCHGLTQDSLVVASKLEHLAILDISFTAPLFTTVDAIEVFTERRAETLREFHYNDSLNWAAFEDLMENISTCCYNLEVLDLSNSMPNSIPGSYVYDFKVHALQVGCPKLRVLKLKNSRLTPNYLPIWVAQQNRGYFLNLEVLACPMISSDEQAYSLLSGCVKLEYLDMSFASSLSYLQHLPTRLLKHLKVPSKRDCTADILYIKEFAATLRSLSFSYGPVTVGTDQIDNAMKELFKSSNRMSNLQHLSLCSCKISTDCLCYILKECRKLEYLNTVQCNKLMHKWQGELTGADLQELYHFVNGNIPGDELVSLQVVDSPEQK